MGVEGTACLLCFLNRFFKRCALKGDAYENEQANRSGMSQTNKAAQMWPTFINRPQCAKEPGNAATLFPIKGSLESAPYLASLPAQT